MTSNKKHTLRNKRIYFVFKLYYKQMRCKKCTLLSSWSKKKFLHSTCIHATVTSICQQCWWKNKNRGVRLGPVHQIIIDDILFKLYYFLLFFIASHLTIKIKIIIGQVKFVSSHLFNPNFKYKIIHSSFIKSFRIIYTLSASKNIIIFYLLKSIIISSY